MEHLYFYVIPVLVVFNTIDSGYEVHSPITLSGKKYALNKMHALKTGFQVL